MKIADETTTLSLRTIDGKEYLNISTGITTYSCSGLIYKGLEKADISSLLSKDLTIIVTEEKIPQDIIDGVNAYLDAYKKSFL